MDLLGYINQAKTQSKKVRMKRCAKCRELKPATTEFFYFDSEKKDKLAFKCKVCCHKLNNERSNRHKQYNERYGLNLEGMKKCPICLKLLPKTEFHKCITNKDGLNDHCKKCASIRMKKNKYGISEP
jgi:hypothetical protein